MTNDLLAGYLTEDEAATQRGKSKRALRKERQLRTGPPYVKDGRKTLYPVDGHRDWLKGNERLPVLVGPKPEPRVPRPTPKRCLEPVGG